MHSGMSGKDRVVKTFPSEQPPVFGPESLAGAKAHAERRRVRVPRPPTVCGRAGARDKGHGQP